MKAQMVAAGYDIERVALPPPPNTGPAGRTKDDVEAQAARTRYLVAGCYTIGLAADSALSGVIVVRFTIDPDGTVSNAHVSHSNIGNSDVEDCVAKAVQRWRFSTGASSDTYEYPFAFEPG